MDSGYQLDWERKAFDNWQSTRLSCFPFLGLCQTSHRVTPLPPLIMMAYHKEGKAVRVLLWAQICDSYERECFKHRFRRSFAEVYKLQGGTCCAWCDATKVM